MLSGRFLPEADPLSQQPGPMSQSMPPHRLKSGRGTETGPLTFDFFQRGGFTKNRELQLTSQTILQLNFSR